MEKRGISTEVKVGIFVFIGLIVLGYMTLRVERIKLKTTDGYEIAALFDSASGLVKSSPIQIAGIEVGRVKDIRLSGNQAKVIMTIQKEVPIYADAGAVLRTQGVLGDKYIEIYPGEEKSSRLPAGGVIKATRSTIELDHILAKAMPVMDDIRSVTKSLSQVVGGDEGQNNLKETFFNIKKSTEDIRSMTSGLSRGEGTIGKLIREEALYQDMRATMSGLKETVSQIQSGQGTIGKLVKDEEFFNETKKAMTSLQNVAKKIDSGEGTLGKLIHDDSLYKEAKETMANLNQTTRKINQGEGTLGKLINDDKLYKETNYTLRSVTKATEGLTEQVPVSILGTVIGTILLSK
jgi:phospholipid/cholesterol/gamma-HCH transport system substrate-binding protein